MKKQFLRSILLSLILLPLSSCGEKITSSTVLPPIDDKIHIYFIEMKKQYGDSILIKQNDFTMLIDMGQSNDEPQIKKAIADYAGGELDALIITHPHGDHYGASSLLRDASHDYKVKLLIDSGYRQPSSDNYVATRDYLSSKGTKICTAYQSVSNSKDCHKVYDKSNFGEMSDKLSIEIVDTKMYGTEDTLTSVPSGTDLNSVSVATIIRYGEFSFFTAGDLTSEVENSIVRDKTISSEVTLYKASHHASGGSNSSAFLKLLSPKVIGISTALVNPNAVSQPHPNKNALARMVATESVLGNIYLNFVNGTTVYEGALDGSFKVTGMGPTKFKYPGFDPTKDKDIRLIDTLYYKDYLKI